MFIKIRYILGIGLAALLTFTACEQSFTGANDEQPKQLNAIEFDQNSMSKAQADIRLRSAINIQDINAALESNGANYRVAFAETVTLSEDGNHRGGQQIFANDREKQLGAQWVPGDIRRNADDNNLTYLVFQPFRLANGSIDSEPAIDASFDTWNNIKKNSKLSIKKVADTGANPSVLLNIGGPGNPFLADISEVGFLPGFIFDTVLGPGASQSVLGVTFTFTFIDGDGNPTDVNNDGYSDVALKEVWYNDSFLWTTDPNGIGTDIETVALHENGHALGFGHFGKVSVINERKLSVSPRAVMNALVLGTQRELLGTDKASFNSIYGNWPE